MIERHWVCPNCTTTAVTHDSRPHTEYHSCRGLAGIDAPLVLEGVRCKIEAHEREDYLGTDIQRRDGNGRTIASVITTRDDGNDCLAFAPTATARVQDLELEDRDIETLRRRLMRA